MIDVTELPSLSRTELENLLTGGANPMLTLSERAAIEAELDRRGFRLPESFNEEGGAYAEARWLVDEEAAEEFRK